MKIKIDPELAVRLLTPLEALELLAPHLENRKKRVHTFTGASFGLMGCNMDLTTIKERLKLAEPDEITLSGDNMKAMGHGVALWNPKYRSWEFLESDKAKIDAIHKLRRIK